MPLSPRPFFPALLVPFFVSPLPLPQIQFFGPDSLSGDGFPPLVPFPASFSDTRVCEKLSPLPAYGREKTSHRNLLFTGPILIQPDVVPTPQGHTTLFYTDSPFPPLADSPLFPTAPLVLFIPFWYGMEAWIFRTDLRGSFPPQVLFFPLLLDPLPFHPGERLPELSRDRTPFISYPPPPLSKLYCFLQGLVSLSLPRLNRGPPRLAESLRTPHSNCTDLVFCLKGFLTLPLTIFRRELTRTFPSQ